MARTQAFTVPEVYQSAVDLFQQYYLQLLPLLLIVAATSTIDTFVTQQYPSYTYFVGIIISFVLTLTNIVIILSLVRLEDKKELEFRQLFKDALPLFIPVLVQLILLGLVIGFGFLLLVIPAIFWGVIFSQAYFFVILEKKGPVEAFRLSQQLTKGRRWQILGIYILPIVVFSVFGFFFYWQIQANLVLLLLSEFFLNNLLVGTYVTILSYVLWKYLQKTAPAIKK